MNLISTLLLFVFIASCSKPGSNSPNETVSDVDNNIVRFEELQISVPLSGIPTAPVSLDFASLAFKQSGVQDLILYNNASSGSITYLASDFDSSLSAPFVVKNNCILALGARKKCTISFSIANASSLPDPQTISSLFKVKGVDVNLSAVLDKDNTDYTAPVASVTVSPLALDFGSFKVGEFRELSIVVRNNAISGSTPISVGTISNPNIIISSNLCPPNLANRSSCTIKMKYTGVAAETFTAANLIRIANNQVTYSGTVTSPSVIEPEVLSIVPATPSINVAITQPNTQTGSIVFNNLGTLPLNAPVAGVSSDDGVVINSITCLGGLARSKSCTVNYTINSPSLPAGVSVQAIKLQSGILASESFLLNFTVTPNILPCTLADLSTNGVSVLNSNSSLVGNKVGSDVSQCLLASNACNQYYSLATDSKSCKASTIACTSSDTAANLWNTVNAATFTGNRIGSDVSACAVATCNLNYEINGKNCTAIVCTQANSGIANVLTVTGTKVSGCLVNTCINEFEKVANTCNAVACNVINSIGNGLTSILNVATVSGTINNDSCRVSTCNQYYSVSGDSKSCIANVVACSSSDTAANGWNVTQALTFSGNKIASNVTACVISSCQANYFLDQTTKSCLPDVITYVPSFSGYGLCSASLPCDGAGTQSRTITSCQKFLNGTPVTGGQIANCIVDPSSLIQACYSPEGINGNLFCEEGQTTGTIVVADNCLSGEEFDGESCIPYSSFNGWEITHVNPTTSYSNLTASYYPVSSAANNLGALSVPLNTSFIKNYTFQTEINTSIAFPNLNTVIKKNIYETSGLYIYPLNSTYSYSFENIVANVVDGLFAPPSPNNGASILVRNYEVTKLHNTVAAPRFVMNTPIEFNGYTYYVCTLANGDVKICRQNLEGTNNLIVSNLNSAGSDISYSNDPYQNSFKLFNNELYFIGTPSSTLSHVYKITTNNEIKQVSNYFTREFSSYAKLIEFNNALYTEVFTTSSFTIIKIMKITSSGYRILNINPISTSDVSQNSFYTTATVFNNKLYFLGLNSSGYIKLMSLDTSDSVKQVLQLGPNNESFSQFKIYDNSLFFLTPSAKFCKIDQSDILSCGGGNLLNSYNYHVYNDEIFYINYPSGLARGLSKMSLIDLASQTSYTNLRDLPFSGRFGNTDAKIIWSSDKIIVFMTADGLSTYSDSLFLMNLENGTVKKVDTSFVYSIAGFSNTHMVEWNSELFFTAMDVSKGASISQLYKLTREGKIVQVLPDIGFGGLQDSVNSIFVYKNKLYISYRVNYVDYMLKFSRE